jgi:hypothetical protein
MVPQVVQGAFLALRPFFMVTSSEVVGSNCFLHLRQYIGLV